MLKNMGKKSSNVIKKIEFGVLEFLLALLIITGIIGYFWHLPGDMEWLDHTASFLVFTYLFYELGITSILFGSNIKKMNLMILISYFLLFFKDILAFTKKIVFELEVFWLGFLENAVLFVDDNPKILIWLIYIGAAGLLAASYYLAKKMEIKHPSFLYALKSGPFKYKILKFASIFLILLWFYFFVFNIILEWLEFSLDDPIIVVGIVFFIARFAKHKEKFHKEHFVFRIGKFADNIYKRFISLFHYKKTLPLAISGILILHALADIGVFAFSLLTGKQNFLQQLSGNNVPFYSLYLNNLGLVSGTAKIGLTIGYLLNALSLVIILLIPVVAWFRIFYQKELHLKRIFLPIIYSSVIAFLLLPAYTLSETYPVEQIRNEGIVGVNIVSKSLLESSSILNLFSNNQNTIINLTAVISLAAGALVYFLSQNKRFRKELYAITVFIGMFFFTGYIFNFSANLFTFYYIQISDFILTPNFFLGIIFIILLLISILFYIGGFLMLLYELIMEYHYRKWSDPVDEELVKAVNRIRRWV